MKDTRQCQHSLSQYHAKSGLTDCRSATHHPWAMSVFVSAILGLSVALSGCNKAEQPAADTTVADAPATTDTTAQTTETQTTEPVATPEVTAEPEVAPEVAATPEVTPAPEATEAAATATPELSANAGKVLYEKQCQVCHAQGLLEAPKYGNKEAWAAHLAKGKETLYEHSAKGFNKMPPQAVNGVSEAEVKAAVDYMIAGVS